MFAVDKVDENEQRNLKILELEINLYTLSDAIEEIEEIKVKINNNITKYVELEDEKRISEMLKAVVYAEEVWVNVARSITMIEEQLQAFREISEVTVQLLIRQSRRDIFFFDKCRSYLNKLCENTEADQEDSKASQAREKLTLPQWIRKVEINEKEIENEVAILLTEKSVDEYESFLKNFVNKVQIDIKIRETFNMARRSPTSTEVLDCVPSSYMGTIAKFQDFFGLDDNGEPLDYTQNPFENEFRISKVRNMIDDGDESPDIRKSIMVCVENYDDESDE